MNKIDFNDVAFKGFEDKEDILLDTGIILAYLNKYDTWHNTVRNLFTNHIFSNDNTLFLYINPCILNEVVHLTQQGKSIDSYLKKHSGVTLPAGELKRVEDQSITTLQTLIANEILIPLEGESDTYLKQLETYSKLGSADAYNASLANEYSISLLTVDNRLVNNIIANSSEFKDINNLYYTAPAHKTY